jgi:hypothetical protein
MVISFVVRLVGTAFEEGHIAGEVQTIATGERITFRTSDELIAALVRECTV